MGSNKPYLEGLMLVNTDDLSKALNGLKIAINERRLRNKQQQIQATVLKCANKGLLFSLGGQKRMVDVFEKFIKEGGTKEERAIRLQKSEDLKKRTFKFSQEAKELRKRTKEGVAKVFGDFHKNSEPFYKKMREAGIIDNQGNIIAKP